MLVLWRRPSAAWLAGGRAFAVQATPAATKSAAAPSSPRAAAAKQEDRAVKGPVQKRQPTPTSRRTGAIAVKCGMTAAWDDWGVRVPLTVLQLDRCQVIQTKTQQTDGYTALQLGAGYRKPQNVSKAMQTHFMQHEVAPKMKLFEFRVTPDALLPSGTDITVSHFVPGQYVDVTGTSLGKGTQGVMKRWGFKGQPATHGVSVTHRHPGSTGQRQSPGKVFKGKKMAGRMGNEQITVQNLQVFKIDREKELLFVKGAVPGFAGNWLRVRDAVKMPQQILTLPFPTFVPEAGKTYPPQEVAKPAPIDPFEVMESEREDKTQPAD